MPAQRAHTDLEAEQSGLRPSRDSGARIGTATQASSVAVVENGQLVLRPPPNVVVYDGLVTTRPFDLSAGGVSVEIAQLLNSGPAEVELMLTANPNRGDAYFMIFATTSFLGLRKQVGIVRDEEQSIPSASSRFWRISFDAGMALFETSPSGEYGTWVVRHDTPVDMPTDELFVLLAVGVYESTFPNPGEAHLDHYLKLITRG